METTFAEQITNSSTPCRIRWREQAKREGYSFDPSAPELIVISDNESTEMNILPKEATSMWLGERGWAQKDSGRVYSKVPLISYRGTFEPSGDVASNSLEDLLSRIWDQPVGSGLLMLYSTFPADPAPTLVYQYLLGLEGASNAWPHDVRLYFEDEYAGILSHLSWYMACGWTGIFVAQNAHFAIHTDDDELEVHWATTQQVKSGTIEFLEDSEFQKIDGSRSV